MDVEGRRDFWSSIRRDAERGRTVMFATHYLDEADSYADRIVLIRQGSIVADGTTAEIKNMASGRLVRATLIASNASEVSDAHERALAAITGVANVERRGDTLLVRCSDSDAVARWLLTHTDARDLEITSSNLEAAFVALKLAIKKLLAENKLTEDPLLGNVAAVSVGIVNDQVLLDLCYAEDVAATVDMNIVMTSKGEFIEVQGSGEEATFTDAQLSAMLALAKGGIRQLFAAQEAAVTAA